MRKIIVLLLGAAIIVSLMALQAPELAEAQVEVDASLPVLGLHSVLPKQLVRSL